MSAAPDEMTEYDWFGEARCRETSGDDEGAIEAYKSAVKLNPEFAKAWYYLALAYYKLDRKEDAKEASKKAIAIKPSWKKYIEKYMPDLGL